MTALIVAVVANSVAAVCDVVLLILELRWWR